MRTTSVTLPAELVERIADLGLTFPGLGSRSEVIRTALEHHHDSSTWRTWWTQAGASSGGSPAGA